MTIEHYQPYIEKRTTLSKKYSRSGRKVDVYWNSENQNYVIARAGSKSIFHEFLFGEDISSEKIRLIFCKYENGPCLRDELTLQQIAIQANKAKENSIKREQFEYAGSELYDYGAAGKHSIS